MELEEFFNNAFKKIDIDLPFKRLESNISNYQKYSLSVNLPPSIQSDEMYYNLLREKIVGEINQYILKVVIGDIKSNGSVNFIDVLNITNDTDYSTMATMSRKIVSEIKMLNLTNVITNGRISSDYIMDSSVFNFVPIKNQKMNAFTKQGNLFGSVDVYIDQYMKWTDDFILSYDDVYYDISDIKIAEFHDIYIQTMKRRGTNKSFLYSFQEFKRFINNNEKYSAICTIYFKDIPISSELILISKDSIYSFLGGTDENYFDKRPNDFLKFEALNWARAQGKNHYILGGGYSLEDGIFQYKKGFFPNDVVDFYTGRKILNQKVYDQLVTKAFNFKLSEGMVILDIEDDTFFPLYRKKD